MQAAFDNAAAAGMISQDGKTVAFNRGGFRYWRKRYRGNNNTDIWVQDLASKKITQLTDLNVKQFRKHTQDAYPMWGADGRIYFMSERDGVFNLWRIGLDGAGLEQVTHVWSLSGKRIIAGMSAGVPRSRARAPSSVENVSPCTRTMPSRSFPKMPRRPTAVLPRIRRTQNSILGTDTMSGPS